MLLLANSQVDIWAADWIETTECRGVGAVDEGIGKTGNRSPASGSEVRAELRLEQPGGISAGRGHDDIGRHVQGKDLARRRLGPALNINHTVEAVDRAYIVKDGRKPIRWNGDVHGSGADILRSRAGITFPNKRSR